MTLRKQALGSNRFERNDPGIGDLTDRAVPWINASPRFTAHGLWAEPHRHRVGSLWEEHPFRSPRCLDRGISREPARVAPGGLLQGARRDQRSTCWKHVWSQMNGFGQQW